MTALKKFRGVVPPVITPVTPDGALDEPAVRRIVDHIVGGGVEGVFILGTTGESASVPMDMRRRFIQVAAEHLRGRALLYVGIGDNCFANSVAAAAEAFRCGADAVVGQLPSYYPLTAEEIFAYYSALADQVAGPLLMYNIPSTTHMSIPVDVVERLAEHPRIVGFKDSENDAKRMDEVAARLLGRDGFSLFVGVGVLSAKGLLLGLDGLVPSAANLEPRGWVAMCEAARRGDRAETERLQVEVNRLAPVLQHGRTLGQSLASLKAAMSLFGLCGTAMLPPLHAASSESVEKIRAGLADIGLSPASRKADGTN
jgi:2-dehydro-3-deoxy-D-pentonate aldolase